MDTGLEARAFLGWLLGLGTVHGQCDSGGLALPPVQYLWQQTLPLRRLSLPDEYPARKNSGVGGTLDVIIVFRIV